METAQDKPIDLRHYRRVLWRRKGLILLASVGVLCGSAMALTAIHPVYQSEVTLLIEDRQPLAREIEDVLGGNGSQVTAFRANEERLSQMVGRVRSRPFLERVIKILKMDEDPKIRAEARKRLDSHPGLTEDELAIRILVARLQNQIRFGSTGPGLYKIIVFHESAQGAQLLAKWISELFVDITTQKELDRIRAARSFGEEQQRVYEEQLTRSEEALERFKGSMIGASFSGTVVTDANRGMAEALDRRINDEVRTAESRVPPLGRAAEALGMAPGDTRLENDADVIGYSRRITAALEQSAQDILAGAGAPAAAGTEGPSWPPKGSVDVTRRDLYRRLETLAGTFYPDASPDVRRAIAAWAFARVDASIQSEVSGWLRGGIEAFRHQAESRPADEIDLARLEEDVKKNRELLQSFRAQMVASDVSQAVETTNLGTRVEILDPAQTPLRPSHPNKMRIFMAALLIGPMLGVALSVAAEVFDPTLRTLDDIRRIAPEPIFGTIPLLTALAKRERGIRRHWIPATLGGIVLLTALFFVARATVLPDLGASPPVKVVDPGNGAIP
jgi:uncharacterized protein involved in exopolysaccharide biosynthesis